jgi:transposase
MKPLRINEAETIILGLQDEIRRSESARYDHRLHAVLLVAQGMSGREAAHILGDAPRTVALWVRRFEAEGLAGLAETPRPGRPHRLSEANLASLEEVLRKAPSEVGLVGNLWDGKTLAQYIQQACGVKLGVRQCQRLFRQLGFRLRKPRPVIAKADPEKQAAYKKKAADATGQR